MNQLTGSLGENRRTERSDYAGTDPKDLPRIGLYVTSDQKL